MTVYGLYSCGVFLDQVLQAYNFCKYYKGDIILWQKLKHSRDFATPKKRGI